jgi:HNH endonuclease
MARDRNFALWGNCPHCGKEFKRKVRIRNHYSGAHAPGHAMGLMPQKYCSRACSNKARAKGSLDKHGYLIVSMGSRQAGQRPEHRVVMEKMIGRSLLKGETVHHKNGNRRDNRPENLELWSSRHGGGQRVEDRIRDAKEFLAEHNRQWDTFGHGDVYNLQLTGG